MEKEKRLKLLYTDWKGTAPETIERLPGSGSYRIYYRITGNEGTIIGVFNEDVSENEAFLSFTSHFRSLHLPVPEVLKVSDDRRFYLLSDLGDLTLFDLLSSKRNGAEFPEEIVLLYKKVLNILPAFQVKAAAGIDYSKCYPRAAFDRQSMHWDLNYFKYYFLKLAKIPFDEQKLEDDFNSLMDFLLTAGQDFFLYRDFQSRNIMIVNGEPWFIDYQGGRKGALHYDLASLLFDGKAAIPPDVRQLLLEHYMNVLDKYLEYDHAGFLKLYNGFVLIRIFQAMGAYGFRGYYEKKTHFLQSIPFAVKNLKFLMDHNLIPPGLPVIREVIRMIIENRELAKISPNLGTGGSRPAPTNQIPGLTVRIVSFSYKKGFPADDSGHGGGFIFDCRALPNPGRYPEYSKVSGKDQPVIDYLKKEGHVDEYLEHVFALVDKSVSEYLRRGFTNLSVGFGCTGGQHRSVYCSEKLAAHLKEKFDVNVVLDHLEKENWIR